MNRIDSKFKNKLRRQNRVRTMVRGTADRPRLSVFVSNKHISAQLIDDTAHKTLLSASSASVKSGNLTEKAKNVGEEVAKKAIDMKIKNAAFDRGPKLYHGRIKALADAARNAGLEF